MMKTKTSVWTVLELVMETREVLSSAAVDECLNIDNECYILPTRYRENEKCVGNRIKGWTHKSSSSTYPFLPKHQACIHACGYTVNQW
jgi:hypothetical protein